MVDDPTDTAGPAGQDRIQGSAALTVRESAVRKCEHGYDHAHPFKDPGEPFRDCPGPPPKATTGANDGT